MGNISTLACMNDKSGNLSSTRWASALSNDGLLRVEESVETLLSSSCCSLDAGAGSVGDDGEKPPKNSSSRLDVLLSAEALAPAEDKVDRNSRSSRVDALGCSNGFTSPLDVQSNWAGGMLSCALFTTLTCSFALHHTLP